MFLPGESQGQGAWRADVYGVAQSRTRLKRLSSSSSSRATANSWDRYSLKATAFFQIVITTYTQRQCFWDPINHYHSNNLYCLFSSSVNLMSEKSYFSVSLMTFTQILMKLNIFHIYRPFILPLCKIPCSFCLPIFLSGVYFLFTNYYSLYTLKLVVNCVPKSSSLPEAWGTECMFSLSSTNVKFIILIWLHQSTFSFIVYTLLLILF